MNKGLSLCLSALLMALPACHQAAPPEAPLAGAKIGGPFVLTDQNGQRFDSKQLAGSYPIVYFGYTFCPDVCPLDMAVLGKGLAAFEKSDPARAAKVRPIFITVDPARDTPAVLRQFVGNFHPRLIGLTGSKAQIDAVAKEYSAFHKAEPPAPGTKGYMVDHSRTAILFGPKGEPIAMVPVDADAAQVAQVLETWVR